MRITKVTAPQKYEAVERHTFYHLRQGLNTEGKELG
jgi:hypothetical protein